jgi:hypothetical protein
MKKRLTFLFIFLSLSCLAQQEPDRQEMLDQLADELLSTVDGDASYEELYETLTHLLANPVDINQVTREQLMAILLLRESEINAFLRFRETAGPLISVLELQAVPGWSIATVRKILPFVKVSDQESRLNAGILKRMATEANQYLVMRYERTLESQKGYLGTTDSSQRYVGAPDKIHLRLRVARTNDFSIGFTAEKDPGEPLSWNPSKRRYGFDYYSYHLQLIRKGFLDNLILGDFQCQFGQGLQFGSAFGLGKTAQTITGIRRSNLGFLPYMSANESFFLRGAAVTATLTGGLKVHAFASAKNSDAHQGEEGITSMPQSGLHRTAGEELSREKLSDRDIGVSLQYLSEWLDAGILLHQKDFGNSFNPSTSIYNQFQFRGNGYRNVGAYLNASLGNFAVFSEVAKTLSHGWAITVGALGNLGPTVEMSWLFRKFGLDYYSSYANAISEGSSPENELGLYWGFRHSPSRRLVASGYLDVFQFPWLRYRIYRPSDGYEWLLRLDYSPSKTTTFFIQFREEVKERNSSGNELGHTVVQGRRTNFWLNGQFTVTPGLTLTGRIQGSEYELGGRSSAGLAVVQEVSWKFRRFSISARYALFDTDDYDNRQYVYEKDVWMATSLPAYEGSGLRTYVLAHYSISRNVDVWVRWARTWYNDRNEIGVGGDLIAGNARNDVKFQVRIRP